jgi:LytS/YehU family sensor histidine kinase
MVTSILFFFHLYRLRQQAKLQRLNHTLQSVQQKALAQYMNPHFIFNCLNSIRKIILENDPADADIHLVRFAKLMRLNLEYSQQLTIPLENEIEVLELYISMEKLRFKDKFQYDIAVEDDIDTTDLKIPALLLQPWVENSILHGIRPKETLGHITIRIGSKSEEALFISIEDDGIGRQNRKVSNASHKSYGSGLTKQRLDLLARLHNFKNEFRIVDLTDEGLATGTRVEFTLPLIY